MKNYDYEQLIKAGYKIENALIESVDLSMADYGCMTLAMILKGGSWGVVYGGYSLGHGYLDAKEFSGSASGMESIMRIMDVVGVARFQDLKGKYVRVAIKGWGHSVKIVGNILKDKWFDIETFFADKEDKQ